MRRVTELDAIRGLAALSILICHLRPEIALGWTRVDLFLVLSGYLVTSVILKYQTSRGFLLVFFVRRAIRIWPVYFLTLLTLVVANLLLPEPRPMDALPYYLTFTQNVPCYWSATAPRFNHYFYHTWTLAVEEQFYLFWPAVVCLAGRKRLIPLTVLLAAVAVAVAARMGGFNPWLLAARCDGLALGGLMATLLADTERVRRHLGAYRCGFVLVACGALAFLIWTVSTAGGREFYAPLSPQQALTIFAGSAFYCGVIGLLICSTGHRALGFLRSRRLAYLGSISYGIYLYHPLVFAAITQAGNRLGLGSPWWLDAVKIAAGLAVAALSWECFERPVLALKDRFPYQPASDRAPDLSAAMPSVISP